MILTSLSDQSICDWSDSTIIFSEGIESPFITAVWRPGLTVDIVNSCLKFFSVFKGCKPILLNSFSINFADLNTFLAKYKPGNEVALTFEHRGTIKNTKIVLQEDNSLEVVTAESAGTTITPTMQSFRDKWLSSQVR